MKLSRLSNRQLRRLLAQGEVRFADEKQEIREALRRNISRIKTAFYTNEKLSNGRDLYTVLYENYEPVYNKSQRIGIQIINAIRQLEKLIQEIK